MSYFKILTLFCLLATSSSALRCDRQQKLVETRRLTTCVNNAVGRGSDRLVGTAMTGLADHADAFCSELMALGTCYNERVDRCTPIAQLQDEKRADLSRRIANSPVKLKPSCNLDVM